MYLTFSIVKKNYNKKSQKAEEVQRVWTTRYLESRMNLSRLLILYFAITALLKACRKVVSGSQSMIDSLLSTVKFFTASQCFPNKRRVSTPMFLFRNEASNLRLWYVLLPAISRNCHDYTRAYAHSGKWSEWKYTLSFQGYYNQFIDCQPFANHLTVSDDLHVNVFPWIIRAIVAPANRRASLVHGHQWPPIVI